MARRHGGCFGGALAHNSPSNSLSPWTSVISVLPRQKPRGAMESRKRFGRASRPLFTVPRRTRVGMSLHACCFVGEGSPNPS